MFRPPRRVVPRSRAGRDLGRYFPRHRRSDSAPGAGTVLDGEAVIWDGQRTDFAALQRRVTAGVDPTAPAIYVAFDLLQRPTQGVVASLPLSARRALLVEALADTPPAIGACPQTDDVTVADNWMADWTPAGIEGSSICVMCCFAADLALFTAPPTHGHRRVTNDCQCSEIHR